MNDGYRSHDLGLSVLPAGLLRSRFSLPRLRLLLPRSVLVVLTSLPSRGGHPGYFSFCFQPCLCDSILCVWYVQDLEGLVDALLVSPAASTVYMTGELRKHAAAACAAAFDLFDFCDGGFVDLVGDLAFFSLVDCSAAAFVYEYCECGKLAVAAAAPTIELLGLFEVSFSFLVGGFMLTSLLVPSVAALSCVFCKLSKLAAAAFAAARKVDGCHDFVSSVLVGIFLLGLLVVLDGVSTVLDGDSLVPVGALFLFVVYFCLPGGRHPKEESLLWTHFLHISVRLIAIQSSFRDQGEHGAVSSLLVGMGQASGRVDVPDGAKIEAAAANAGALRSRPGKLDALGLVRSREGIFKFSERL